MSISLECEIKSMNTVRISMQIFEKQMLSRNHSLVEARNVVLLWASSFLSWRPEDISGLNGSAHLLNVLVLTTPKSTG